MARHIHRQKTTGKVQRNSSVELLRLLAMFMIVGFHYAFGDGIWVAKQPISITKFIYQMIYMPGGWVGNFIFFVISVWYLLDRDVSLHSSLRRVWILERELLFWSLTLFALTVWLKQKGIYSGGGIGALGVKSVFPLSLNLWWYPTSYALFLLFMPFLVRGMRSLGHDLHRSVAMICLILWGFLGLIPKFQYNLNKCSVFVFIYWFILISYYRWYMRSLTRDQCCGLIGAGVAVLLLYWIVTNAIFAYTGKMAGAQSFIFNHWSLPEMMIGFGIFLLVVRTQFHSRVVNYIAASAFGIYLIHFYPSIWSCINKYMGVNIVYESRLPILYGAAAIASIFCVCLALDLIRHVLFSVTIDRHRGRCFEFIYDRCSKIQIRIRSHSASHLTGE